MNRRTLLLLSYALAGEAFWVTLLLAFRFVLPPPFRRSAVAQRARGDRAYRYCGRNPIMIRLCLSLVKHRPGFLYHHSNKPR